MALPIRHHLYRMAEFRRPVSAGSNGRIRAALLAVSADLRRLAEAVHASTLTSLSPNRSGLKLRLRFRVPGHGAASVGLSPFEVSGGHRQPRTRDGIFEEVAQALIWKDALGVRSAVSAKTEVWGPDVGEASLSALRFLPARRGFLDDVLDSLRSVGESGALDAAYSRHNGERALELFRENALQAIGFGIPHERLRDALDECVVRSVMEET